MLNKNTNTISTNWSLAKLGSNKYILLYETLWVFFHLSILVGKILLWPKSIFKYVNKIKSNF